MSNEADVFVASSEKKLRFRPPTKVHYNSDIKTEDFHKSSDSNTQKHEDVPVTEHKDTKRG